MKFVDDYNGSQYVVNAEGSAPRARISSLSAWCLNCTLRAESTQRH